MINQEIAKIFYGIADILEMKDVEWKPIAYRKAARSLETLQKDVKDIYKKQGLKGLDKIPGVGQALAKKIIEYIEKGKIKEYERLKKQIPKGLEKLMDIMGLGAKRANILYKKLHIKNITDLKKALKKHKIEKLEGFGLKSEENIKKSLELLKERKKRFPLGIAYPIAKNIVEELKKLKQVHKINVGGSLRRMNETIGDIDILITTNNPKPVMDLFTKLPEVKRVLAKGQTKSMVILKNNIQADVRVVPDNSYGAALQYFTGNKEHNIELRKIAIKKNLKLSEYGIFSKKTNRKVAGKTEQEVYKKLGLKIMPPELRQNKGEIQASQKNKLPKLIELKDIKGDLHIHSKYSDGNESILEIVKAAKKLKYSYIAITDHSKTRAIAHGLKEKTLLKQIKEIQRLNKKLKNFKILSGTEVDIKADGSLDYNDKILRKLDIVIVAIHSGFKSTKKEMTNRIIKALENKHVNILAHPTGRLINQRPPYEIDLELIFQVAKEKKKFLEINAFPDRLDLNDINIKAAIEQGVKLVIGTDSHSINHLEFMEYGVAQARRGWAEKKEILNCLTYKQLKKSI